MRILDLLFISVQLLAQIALTIAANMLVKLGAHSSSAAGGMLNGIAELKTLAWPRLLGLRVPAILACAATSCA